MAVVMMISTSMCMSMRVGYTDVVMLMRMLCPGPRLATRVRVFVMWIIVRVLVRVSNWKMTVGMRMLCHVCPSSNDRNLFFGS